MQVKAVIFDMDGVLVDAREWHFRALNKGLSNFGVEINQEEHLTTFNGLPTKVKLKKLEESGRLPSVAFRFVEAVKQEWTLREAANLCFPRLEHLILVGALKSKGYKIGVATNSIRKTSSTMLAYSGLLDLLDCVVTNEDVSKAKPSPDIYELACARLDVLPEECLVVEDHDYGIEAARSAGCHTVRVTGPEEVTSKLVLERIEAINER